MTTLDETKIEAALRAHELAERANDLDAVRATLVENPHYELAMLGWQIDGQEGVLEFYRRTITPMMKRGLLATKRLQGVGPNSLLREAYITFDMNGETITGNYCAVIVVDVDDHLVASERLYTDPVYGQILADDLGPDFGDVPGVSRMDWTRGLRYT